MDRKMPPRHQGTRKHQDLTLVKFGVFESWWQENYSFNLK